MGMLGRPRSRWLEDGENDLQELKMKRWRQKENSKGDWAPVVKQYAGDHRPRK
jgi:hypothetical protein